MNKKKGALTKKYGIIKSDNLSYCSFVFPILDIQKTYIDTIFDFACSLGKIADFENYGNNNKVLLPQLQKSCF